MNEQTGATRVADRWDPTLRQRRLEALQQAHRAKRILEHEAEVAARYGAEAVGADRHDGDAEDRTPATAAATREQDIARVHEIHRELQHERKAARRPFHRHAERLVLALELAERLALERLGFHDYADFEARGGEEREGREIIDLAAIELAEHELAAAEATLAELAALDGGGPSPLGRPPTAASSRTADPVLHADVLIRPTRARRSVFEPAGGDRLHLSAPDDNPLVGSPSAAPLPSRRAAPRQGIGADRSDGDDDVLGVIVRDGRTVRVEKAPGLPYTEPDDGDDAGLGPDSITYGDPPR